MMDSKTAQFYKHTFNFIQESPSVWMQEAYHPPCSKYSAEGYLPWLTGGTYLSWLGGYLPWLMRDSYLDRWGYLPWVGGTTLANMWNTYVGYVSTLQEYQKFQTNAEISVILDSMLLYWQMLTLPLFRKNISEIHKYLSHHNSHEFCIITLLEYVL